MKSIIYIYFLISFICGCEENRNKHLIGGYYLVQPDYATEYRSLNYKISDGGYICVVEPKISAVAYNKEYLMVLQKVLPQGNYGFMDQYYIILLVKNVNEKFIPDVNKIGPLSFSEFIDKKHNLNIPDSLELKNLDDVD